ncbi:MAG: hypothetical protein IRZ16_01095 [Myxococcaceae bacterium]|nr:hypothetical protein [Myxococcaceae bacterium]
MRISALPAACGVLAALTLGACASVSPRFSQEVQTSFARDTMRRLETRSLVVYYPQEQKDAVLPTLARLERCVESLCARVLSDTPRDKVVVLVTSAEFNNAFVRAKVLGTPTEMLLPVQMGSELFNLFDFGVTNVGDIACHESVHYVQLEQIDGLWRYANLIFGDIASPNLGTESWFLEGLATWLEGELAVAGGRPHSPLWQGSYDSGVAAQGGLHAGQLSPSHRELLPFGGNYEAGSHFVAWLARRYGEKKLWELIDLQGRSIFFVFGTSLRFKAVYGKTLGGLLDEYNAELAGTLAARTRPSDQRVLVDDLGYYARLGSGPHGELAIAWVGLDQVPVLEVREPDGALRFREPLTRILPERPWIVAHPTAMGAPSFTADGRSLFFFAEDLDVDGNTVYAVRQFDARTGTFIKDWSGLKGVGGAVTPDGTGYVFVQIREGISDLVRLDTRTGNITPLTSLATRDPLGPPAISPDGARIAFPRLKDGGFDLWLREADGSVRRLTFDRGFNYSPGWLDAHTLVFLHDEDGRAQAYALDVDTGATRALTRAPFAVMDPVRASDGRIAFANREGWRWTLDEVPLASARTVTLGTAPGAPRPEAPPVTIVDDRPYSGLDELFIPRLRIPVIGATVDPLNRLQPYGALSLQGFDRLSWHNWALNLTWDGFDREPSVAASYGNAQLAPWFLRADAMRAVDRSALFGSANTAAPGNITGFRTITDYSGTVRASRAFWTSGFSFALRALDRTVRVDPRDGGSSQEHVRLIGPLTSVSWSAGEGTAYAGTRRGLSTDASLAAYPSFAGSSFTLVDVRGALGVWVPLPGLARQTLALSLRGRTLVGPAQGLLQVGGITTGYGYLLRATSTPSERGPNVLLPGLAFTEPLRGFEDIAFHTQSAGILDARYRYPFPIDWGTTSTFWIFPSFFLSQVETEAFFSGAATDAPSRALHGAVGGAVRVRLLFGSALSVSAYYQAAWRFDPGLGFQHVVGLTFD